MVVDHAKLGPVAIAHDYFGIRGGGERLVLTAANDLGARLVCGYRSEDSYDAGDFPIDTITLDPPTLLRRPALRTIVLAAQFAASKHLMRDFDLRLYSGVSAPFAAEASRGGRNVFYCHTPPRFLYDQRHRFAGGIERSLLGRLALDWFQRGYEAAVGRMDTVVANSQTVRHRIRLYLGREAEVVHPPCDLNAFRWLGQGGYYLSTARLSPLKRVDRIVAAFRKMPDRQLVVASSGDQLNALKALADGAPNIIFLGWVSDVQLRKLIGEAIATIYVPVDEDFGMSPVESMAAGKPVIGVAEGGLRETIVHGETGILLPPDFTSDDLAAAVVELTPQRALTMREACVARASLFSQERFLAGLRRVLGV